MRHFLLLFVIVAAGCGDSGSSGLLTRDLADGGESGCVVPERKDPKAPATWTVRPGDSLRLIARRVYGNENLWKAIVAANPGKIGRDGIITPGTELVVPREGV